MPSGRTHDGITLWCLPPLAAAGWWLTQDSSVVLVLSGCFLFSGLMFGPDLDIYSQQYKRWGYLRWIWLPYRRSMSHRSVLSHGVVIGTVLRVAYLVTILLFVLIVGGLIMTAARGLLFYPWFNGGVERIARSLQQYPDRWVAGFIGLEVGSVSHSLSDHIGSAIKRHQRKRARPAQKR
jgi:uncharacterized metal-binding protein